MPTSPLYSRALQASPRWRSVRSLTTPTTEGSLRASLRVVAIIRLYKTHNNPAIWRDFFKKLSQDSSDWVWNYREVICIFANSGQPRSLGRVSVFFSCDFVFPFSVRLGIYFFEETISSGHRQRRRQRRVVETGTHSIKRWFSRVRIKIVAHSK